MYNAHGGARRRTGRRAEPRIRDLRTHPRPHVSLCVAAEFLGLDERTVVARIDAGRLTAFRDGKAWRISIAALAAYDAERRLLTVPRPTAKST